MTQNNKNIGLAIIGCGRVGIMRGKIASEFPGISWIGLCDTNKEIGEKLKEDISADYFTTDYSDLINRPEVDAVIIATSTWSHYEPTLIAINNKQKLFIEKPMATDAIQSLELLKLIQDNGIDACLGYTQRFRRRFMVVRERVKTGQIGEISCAFTRAFMNSMAPLNETRLTQDRRFLTPMVVSGTHSLDMALWIMNDTPVSVYAKSSDKILFDAGTKDATCGIFTLASGAIWSMNISWALPKIWPGASYGLEMGFVGTRGVIDIEDTHRDVIIASEYDQGKIYRPAGREDEVTRNVDFLTSFPPGDIYNGELWGPMKEETFSWLQRICLDKATPHASAEDGHRNLMLTMAMDLSAKLGKEISLPISADDLMSGLNE